MPDKKFTFEAFTKAIKESDDVQQLFVAIKKLVK